MRLIWLLTASMLSAGATTAAPLTYDAALKLADQAAPSLQAKALDVRAARSSAIAAGRLPDPKLEFGVEGFPVSDPSPAARTGTTSAMRASASFRTCRAAPSVGRPASGRRPTSARPRSPGSEKAGLCG